MTLNDRTWFVAANELKEVLGLSALQPHQNIDHLRDLLDSARRTIVQMRTAPINLSADIGELRGALNDALTRLESFQVAHTSNNDSLSR